MTSIIQKDKEGCFVCGRTPTEEHHVFGGANRDLSTKYKLTVQLCPFHHRDSKGGAHFNKKLMDKLHEEGRIAFEREYPNLDFEKIFIRGLDR